MATILTKRSNTASSVPVAGDLTNSTGGAELAVNTADKRLFTKDSGGTVVELGTNPSSVTLPNGTANGVAYLNGSKVLTSGSALTFDGTNLGVGATLPAGSGRPNFNVGYAGTGLVGAQADLSMVSSAYYGGSWKRAEATYQPTRLNISDGVFVWQYASTGSVDSAISWTEQMRLTSTGLGIGTSSPSTKLQVANSTAVNTFATVSNSVATAYYGVDSSGNTYCWNAGAYSVLFGTSGSERMRLDSSGNLGLGVTPSAWSVGKAIESRNAGNAIFTNGAGEMLVTANSYYDGAWRYGATGVQAAQYICGNTNGTHIWKIAASGTAGNAISFTQAMTLDASGNLGVGTTSPSYKLHVQGYVYANSGFTLLSQASGGGSIYEASGNTGIAIGQTSNTLQFTTGGSERARIDSSGNLLINTTSQYNSGRFCVTNGSTSNSIVAKDSGSANYLYVGVNSSGTITFTVETNGNVKNTNNSYGAISDVKLKENIVDATPKLADLMKVKVRNYNLIGDANKQIGVVAQELETVFPSLIDETVDKDDDGNKLNTTTKSVKYSVFVPMLIKAIQELKAEFDAYKASHP